VPSAALFINDAFDVVGYRGFFDAYTSFVVSLTQALFSWFH
jgi:hypothetical protein